MSALETSGPERTRLRECIPADLYAAVRALYLQYRHGNCTHTRAKNFQVPQSEQTQWAKLKGKIHQDAFGELILEFRDMRPLYKLF